MKMEIEIFKPYILTIPDDAAIFSVLNLNKNIAKKIVLENYINFYSSRNLDFGHIEFRFEDYLNYDGITGMNWSVESMSMMKRYHQDSNFIVQRLQDGYVLMMPVERKYISFYGIDANGTHVMMIYGVDTRFEKFKCKDFKGNCFVDFEVSYAELKKSIDNYERPGDYMRAFCVQEIEDVIIDYAKMQNNFYKLKNRFYTNEAGYGLGAIKLFLDEVYNNSAQFIFPRNWFNIANYLRESSKMMILRYRVLEEISGCELGNSNYVLKQLQIDSDIFFSWICKAQIKNKRISLTEIQRLSEMVKKCMNDFDRTADFFSELLIGEKC